jgi:uncharacterized protein (UPF0333 family)
MQVWCQKNNSRVLTHLESEKTNVTEAVAGRGVLQITQYLRTSHRQIAFIVVKAAISGCKLDSLKRKSPS